MLNPRHRHHLRHTDARPDFARIRANITQHIDLTGNLLQASRIGDYDQLRKISRGIKTQVRACRIDANSGLICFDLSRVDLALILSSALGQDRIGQLATVDPADMRGSVTDRTASRSWPLVLARILQKSGDPRTTQEYKGRGKLHLPTGCPVAGLLARVTEILYRVRPPPRQQSA